MSEFDPAGAAPVPGTGHDDIVADRPPEAAASGRPGAPLDLAGTFAIGLAMGTADVVPGFSGGTVALVAGIYERLVANVRQGARTLSLLLRGRLRDAAAAFGAVEWGFVVAVLAGILSAIVALASFLEARLAAAPIAMSALFFGLVLGATVVAVGELRVPTIHHLAIGGVTAAVTFVALGFRTAGFDDPSLVFVFVAGMIAICAMILPGVSGSFLLLLLGVYEPVITAVAARDLLLLVVFTGGTVVGLAGFSTLLNWLLQRWHDVVLAALLGLMAGSTRVLWPWPSATGVGDPTLGAPVAADVPVVLGLATGAAVAVIAFAAVARRIARAT